MVEFLKAKTTTYVNKPRGLINVDTGAKQVGDAIARAGAQAQQMFYEDAVRKQKALGVETVSKMKVQARDEGGNFTYAELDTSLSQVAKETAQPLLRQRMADALLVDASTRLTKIRSESDSSEEFKSKSEAYIKASIDQLDKTGGGEYSAVYQTLASKTMAQHLNHMVLADAKKADRVATNNALYRIETGVNELAGHLSNGTDIIDDGTDEYSADEITASLKAQLTDLFDRDKIQEPKYREAIKNVDKTLNDSKINFKIDPMSTNLDLNALTIMEEAIRTGTINENDVSYLESYGVNQDDIDNFTSVRTNRDYHASKVATIRGVVSKRVQAITKGNKLHEFTQKLDNGTIFSPTTSEQELYDDALGAKYNNGNPITANWVLQNWDKGDFLNDALKSSKFPLAIENIFNNPEQITSMIATNPDKAKAYLLSGIKLFSNATYRQSAAGNTHAMYGISETKHSDWIRLKRLSEQYGDDRVLEFAQKLFLPPQASQTLDTIRKVNIENYSDYDPKRDINANSFVNKWLYNYSKDKGMNPEAATYLKSIAMHHLAIEATDESTLKQIISDSYSNMYKTSSYVWNIGQGVGMQNVLPGGVKFATLATRFAPEKYFEGDETGLLKKFIERTNTNLSKVRLNTGEELKIGNNAFLLPSRRSTNTQGEYMVVDSTGTPVINKQTGNIFQITTNIVKKELLMKRRQEQEERWENARKKRLSVIESKRSAKEDLSGSFLDVIGKVFGKTAF